MGRTYERYKARKANRWPLCREPWLDGTPNKFDGGQRLVPFGGLSGAFWSQSGRAGPLLCRRPIKTTGVMG